MFTYYGPLAPEHPLFRGRSTELAWLTGLCQQEVQAYAIVYGGRQTGKTTLALRLSAYLSPTMPICRIDCQQLSLATPSRLYRHLANQVALTLGISTPPTVQDSSGLINFFCQTLTTTSIPRLVLLLEELGALPSSLQADLANILRAIFSSRFDRPGRPLARLMVIILGSIELYDLAATQVSTLHNVCEACYLPNLSQAEAIDLVIRGMVAQDISVADATTAGQLIYAQVHGHPYLTQYLGASLTKAGKVGQPFSTALAEIVSKLRQENPLLNHLRHALKEYGLESAGRTLLNTRLRFSRLDEEMARLELLGLAHEKDGYWQPRNPLLAEILSNWLDDIGLIVSPPNPKVSNNVAPPIAQAKMVGLSTELYQRCRDILLQCNEFNNDASLQAAFITGELNPFQNGLLEAASRTERVDLNLNFLLSRRLRDGRLLLHLFLTTLRNRYEPGDALRDELAVLAVEVERALTSPPGTAESG